MIRRCLLIPLLAACLSAQTADDKAVSIRFRALALDEPISSAGFLEGGNLREIDIPNNAFTREFSYHGARTLRFVTMPKENPDPTPVSGEMQGASQRLRRAQAASLQASEEFSQVTQLINKLRVQAAEGVRKPSEGDSLRLEALEARLKVLSSVLAAASKEIEEVNLLLLRLESARKPAKHDAKKKNPRKPMPAFSPTVEYTFQKDGEYLLLFSASGSGQRILALDGTDKAFPYGSFQFVNLTGKELEIRYPHRTLTLHVDARTVIRNPARDHEYGLAEILTTAEDGLEVGHVFRALQDPETRSLVFLLAIPDEPHAIRSRTIEDRRTPESK